MWACSFFRWMQLTSVKWPNGVQILKTHRFERQGTARADFFFPTQFWLCYLYCLITTFPEPTSKKGYFKKKGPSEISNWMWQVVMVWGVIYFLFFFFFKLEPNSCGSNPMQISFKIQIISLFIEIIFCPTHMPQYSKSQQKSAFFHASVLCTGQTPLSCFWPSPCSLLSQTGSRQNSNLILMCLCFALVEEVEAN